MSDAQAQYAIDIAAQMDGAPGTLAELTALSDKLSGAGVGADSFQDALLRVTKSLNGAQAANAAANAELAAGNEEYSRLERAALQVAKAAEKAAVANGGIMPPEAAAFVQAGNAALAEQAEKLRGLEGTARATGAEEERLAKTLKNLGTLSKSASGDVEEHEISWRGLRRGLREGGGALGDVASRILEPVAGFAELSEDLGHTTAMAIAFAGAASLVVAGLSALAIKTLSWAVGLADTRRGVELTSEAMQAMNPWLAGLSKGFPEITRATGQTTAQLEALAMKLKTAHVSAANMPAALRAAALAETALGQGGSDEFIKRIQQGGQSVSQLAALTQAKLGGVVAKQMLGLDAQSKTFKDHIGAIFGSLNIEPALQGLSRLVGLFDENTAAGQTLKFVFGTIFQPILDGADKAAISVEAFALRVMIDGLKAYLALRPYTGIFEDIGIVVGVAALAFGATFVPAALAAVAALAGVVATAALAAAPFLAIGLAVTAAYEAFTHWDQIKGFLLGLAREFNTIAGQLVQGFIDGIVAGAGRAAAAVADMAHGALHAAEHALGIASPSKAMKMIAGFTVQGFTGELDRQAPTAQASLAEVVAPPSPADAAAQGATGGALASMKSPADSQKSTAPAAGKGGASVVIQPGAIVISGVTGADDALAKFEEVAARMFEGLALQLGSG